MYAYYVLEFKNFWILKPSFSSTLTLKTASGRPECKDDMDDAAIMNVLMQSFS